MCSLCSVFALRITRANSFLKSWKHQCGEGWIPLKMKSLLCIHKLQQKVMMISIKKGRLIWSLTASKICQVEMPIIIMFNLDQHAKAKGHSKKRWERVSSIPRLQQIHSYVGKTMCRRRRISWYWVYCEEAAKKKNFMFVLTRWFPKPPDSSRQKKS